MKRNLLGFLGVATLVAAQKLETTVTIPSNLSTRPLVRDVYGYSIEPVWVDAYTSSNIATNLMSIITDVTGKPPPIRIGGNTADQTYLKPLDSQDSVSIAYPNETSTEWFNITPAWYDSWATYFPPGTELIYTLNFADNASSFANGVLQAEAISQSLGSNLTMLELGNEIDHFINKDWRPEGYGVDEYVPQWRNLTGQIVESSWYQALESPPPFQAAAFADPPWVPDQQDQIDDFDIINVTAAGLVDEDLIAAYAVHMYPQSTCDPTRWHRMRLDLLSNHTTLWQNISQYVPQVAAADAAGAPLVLGETNSISCSGRSGISDTLGAALWGVDYVLLAASIGIQKVYFHLGAQSEYSSFTPVSYEYKGESLTAGIRPGFHGHYFISQIVAGEDENLSVAALPGANETDLSGFGVYDASGTVLRKLVFLDMGVWNGTEGLSNPSTISATDSETRSNGTRPVRGMQVQVPWPTGSSVDVIRLRGPGTNAKSMVDVSGITFDMDTGDIVGALQEESTTVEQGGLMSFDMKQSEGVLLQLRNQGDGGPPVLPPSGGSLQIGVPMIWIVTGLILATVM